MAINLLSKVLSLLNEKGIDGNKRVNGRKRNIITDSLGLVWAVVVHSAESTDGKQAHRVVQSLLGYLHRVKKIVADAAYKKSFYRWVEENMLGVELEISSKPPSTKGFVPIKWRWVTEQDLWEYNTHQMYHKSTHKSADW